MSHQPLLAVIVPVYKVEDYLRPCVDSILSQSYPNLRIILVDDGSPDGCGAICDAYAAQDSRVVVVHKENGGQSTARNRGLDLAKDCDYITFVDSDDSIEPGIYEAAVTYLEEHREVGIVGYGINEIRAGKRSIAGRRSVTCSLARRRLRRLPKAFHLSSVPQCGPRSSVLR